jgi:hypothetical protein
VLTTLNQALVSNGGANRGCCVGMEVLRCGAGREEQDLPVGTLAFGVSRMERVLRKYE